MSRVAFLPLLLLLHANAALAQVGFDGTLGPAGPAPTRSDLPGFDLDHLIRYDERDPSPQGLRVGDNLFHSLAGLSIPQPAGLRTSATFQALDAAGQPIALRNVIARVTGGAPSVIEGVLRSEIPGADLYLLNPSGVLFRGDASGATLESQLDVPAAFYVSTADSLRFADGSVFRVGDAVPEVSVEMPSDFGFLGGSDAQVALTDRALLRPADGETITIVAGDVSLTGESLVEFAGGSARVAAVGTAATTVPVDVEGFAARDAAPGTLGTIALAMDSAIRPVAADINDPQGRVVLRGGRLVVDDSLVEGSGEETPGRVGVAGSALDVEMADQIVARNDARLLVHSEADVGAGAGHLATRRLEVRGNGTRVGVRTAGAAAAAPFVVEADEVLVTDAGRLVTENRGGSATGGTLEVRAGRLEVRDDGRIASATVFGTATGGDVVIEADQVQVTRSAGAPTGGAIESLTIFGGQGGNLTVDADDVRVEAGGQIRALSGFSGDGGDVTVTGGDLTIRGGGQVRTSTITDRAAGDVTVDVDGAISIVGDGPDPDAPSGIFARSGEDADHAVAGPAGNVTIEGASMSLTGNGTVSTRSFGTGTAGAVAIDLDGDFSAAGGAEISARTADASSGGIAIDAETFALSEGAAISSTTLGSGNAGDVAVDARVVTLRGQSTEILSQSSDSVAADAGDAGTIRVTATDSVQLLDGARISVLSRGAGAAGNVVVDGGQQVLLDGSAITTEAISGINESSGGNIEISADSLVEIRDSALRTSVQGQVGSGDAGNVTIDSRFVVVNDSDVLAKAVFGNGGNIRIAVDSYLESGGSLVDASSEFGVDGTVVVEGPENQLKDELARLPSRFLDASALLREQCAARAAGSGSFVVAGSEGVAAGPDAPLSVAMPLPAPQSDGARPHEPDARAPIPLRLHVSDATCAALARAIEAADAP